MFAQPKTTQLFGKKRNFARLSAAFCTGKVGFYTILHDILWNFARLTLSLRTILPSILGLLALRISTRTTASILCTTISGGLHGIEQLRLFLCTAFCGIYTKNDGYRQRFWASGQSPFIPFLIHCLVILELLGANLLSVLHLFQLQWWFSVCVSPSQRTQIHLLHTKPEPLTYSSCFSPS